MSDVKETHCHDNIKATSLQHHVRFGLPVTGGNNPNSCNSITLTTTSLPVTSGCLVGIAPSPTEAAVILNCWVWALEFGMTIYMKRVSVRYNEKWASWMFLHCWQL
jgi:hypothetical protein